MPRTRDSAPLDGELDLPDCGKDPTSVGGITNNGGELVARDSLGVFNLRQGAAAAGAALCFAVFTVSGGLVYDTSGVPVLKESA